MIRRGNAALVSALIVALLVLSVCATSPRQREASTKVLVMPREGSANIELMVTRGLAVMIRILEEAGFDAVVASAAGKPFAGGTISIPSDLKLSDVRVANYAGFLLPCMAAGESALAPVPTEAVRIVAGAGALGKPIAAQRSGLYTLSEAGLLHGRRHAFLAPVFTEGIYSGTGVVQDGNVITSAVCPYQAQNRPPDGTAELTRALILSISAAGK